MTVWESYSLHDGLSSNDGWRTVAVCKVLCGTDRISPPLATVYKRAVEQAYLPKHSTHTNPLLTSYKHLNNQLNLQTHSLSK